MLRLVWQQLLVIGTAFVVVSNAEFGDYVDPTYNCPATTTCQRVCVATAADCPKTMVCPNGNETLCADGTCAEVCDADLNTPCEFKCAPVACNKVVDLYTNCQELYGYLYQAEAKCGEIETDEETTLFSFNEPGYIFAYTWVSGVTFLVFVWCFFK